MSRTEFFPDSCVVAEVMPSPNHGERKDDRRPDMIVLHYTGMASAGDALTRLCAPDSRVASHYFVFEDGRIVQLVRESRRAWHAGAASWAGDADINSCSIGIEIANPGHDFGYPDFPRRQIAAVTALCRSILTRYTIPAERVLAHSDVAPARKRDPGEKFPWRILYESGVGLWVKPAQIVDGPLLALGDRGDGVMSMQTSLSDYGYGIAVTGQYDSSMHEVVMAFQRHFRPERIDGITDTSTRSTLRDLLSQRGRPRTIAARAINVDRLMKPPPLDAAPQAPHPSLRQSAGRLLRRLPPFRSP